MTGRAGLPFVLGLLGLAACASSHREETGPAGVQEIRGEGESDVVGWKIDLSRDTPILSALGGGAKKAGCQVHHPDATRLLAQCPGGAVAVIQEGRRVLIGCQQMTLDQCRTVFRQILEKTPVKP